VPGEGKGEQTHAGHHPSMSMGRKGRVLQPRASLSLFSLSLSLSLCVCIHVYTHIHTRIMTFGPQDERTLRVCQGTVSHSIAALRLLAVLSPIVSRRGVGGRGGGRGRRGVALERLRDGDVRTL
jgi:hypothetical protein